MEKENDVLGCLEGLLGRQKENGKMLKQVQHDICLGKMPKRCPAGMTDLFNHNIKAFTLIELLVVVLIIGILAAVALPQYQLAVAKARVNRLLPLIKSIENAQEVYKMANGTYADDFALLDVEMPTSNNDILCYPVQGSQYRSMDCRDRKYSFVLEKYYSGNLYCWAMTDETSQKLCKYLCQTNVLSGGNHCTVSL